MYYKNISNALNIIMFIGKINFYHKLMTVINLFCKPKPYSIQKTKKQKYIYKNIRLNRITIVNTIQIFLIEKLTMGKK